MTGAHSAPPLFEILRLACVTNDRLPRYRVLTGPDDASFCYRVSEALDLGYELYGSPALTVNGGTTIVAQALLWPGGDPPPLPAT